MVVYESGRWFICTYAPWGVRGDELAKSRKIPTWKVLLLFFHDREQESRLWPGKTALPRARCRATGSRTGAATSGAGARAAAGARRR